MLPVEPSVQNGCTSNKGIGDMQLRVGAVESAIDVSEFFDSTHSTCNYEFTL
jgi:hypothetical protein